MRAPSLKSAAILLCLLLLGGITADESRPTAPSLLHAVEEVLSSPRVPTEAGAVRLFSLHPLQSTHDFHSTLPELLHSLISLYPAGPPGAPAAMHLIALSVASNCLSVQEVRAHFPQASLPLDPVPSQDSLQLHRGPASVLFFFDRACLKGLDILWALPPRA